MNRTTVNIWICIDEDGDYAIGTDQESARESYDEAFATSGPISLVQLIADCPLPRPIVGRLVVPEAPDQAVSVTFES